jgi:membrane protease YdiL (CAAX protease family)
VPTLVLLALAVVSLAIRRERLSTLGFHRLDRPARFAVRILAFTVAWTVVQLSLVMPILNHATGRRQDLSQFAGLPGNVGMLAGFLALTWTLAALGEELAYRGYLQTRIGDLLGDGRWMVIVAVVVTSALFGAAHSEQGAIGVAVTFLDAGFFSYLRLRYGTLWASVLAHGFNNTIGLTAVFLVGPVYGLW